MRKTLLLVLVVGCSQHAGFDPVDASTSKDVSTPKDSAADVAVDSPASDAAVPDSAASDSGTPPAPDSGQPPADSGTPDSGPPDSGVQGRCFANNQTRPCGMLLDFEIQSPLDGGSSFIVNCHNYQPPCPIGWTCRWLPNHEQGTCIP